MRFSFRDKGSGPEERRRDGSLKSRWPIFLRAAVILILVFWVLWVMLPRFVAPPSEEAPTSAAPGTVTFTEPDELAP